MFRARQTAAFLLTAACALACSSTKNPAPDVPMAGAKSDLSAMAGRWEGSYSSEATGRSGSIVFELKSGKETAKGDVLMVPKGANAPAPSSDPLHGMPQVLNISFVNAEGGVVKGTMDPYRDPDCDCEVQTTFVGLRKGDTIEGTFTTTGTTTLTTGRWSIVRKK
jgi:hypothetical protein